MENLTVLFLTALPGLPQQGVTAAFAERGFAVAEISQLLTEFHSTDVMQNAVESNFYGEVDRAIHQILQELFADITLVSQNLAQKFLISVPSITFFARLCPQSFQILQQKLTFAPRKYQLAILDADLSHLITINHLFGAKNNMIMPRKILRQQRAELNDAVAQFFPVRLNVQPEWTTQEIAEKVFLLAAGK